MKDIIEIEGHKAVVSLDSQTSMLRGEFLGLNGGADFHADNIEDLRREGLASLKVFLDACEENGISPFEKLSGR